MDVNELKKWIKGDEELKLHPYLDTTGHVTIGWGRNLENGISEDEAELMFENDFNRCIKELEQFSWYFSQPDPIKCALINMNFNLGITELLGFHQMIHALIDKNYEEVIKAALDSKWALQVPHRAQEITDMMQKGLKDA